MNLVKLGGSVITDKAKLRTFRPSTCSRLAKEMRSSRAELAIVHGAGSFGHVLAKKHRLHEGFTEKSQLEQVAVVHRDVRELNLRVLEALIDNRLNAVSVPPAAAGVFEKGDVRSFRAGPFKDILDLGLVPVTFGDVVPDLALGFSICSGDLMMLELAKSFEPKLAVFCADVDGVFDNDPKLDKNARLLKVVDRETLGKIRRSEVLTADVTGSIFGKLERMLAIAEHCEKCIIVNGNKPGRLEKALRGKPVVSTTVLPR
jgi:isopentenyl phosphate kinase